MADAAGLQALAGTAPVAFQSGNYAKAHKRYACLKPLRNALYQFAWQSTLEAPAGLSQANEYTHSLVFHSALAPPA
jgi:hypothetical protein